VCGPDRTGEGTVRAKDQGIVRPVGQRQKQIEDKGRQSAQLQQNLDKTNKDMAALGQQKQALDNHLKQTQAKLNDTEKPFPIKSRPPKHH